MLKAFEARSDMKLEFEIVDKVEDRNYNVTNYDQQWVAQVDEVEDNAKLIRAMLGPQDVIVFYGGHILGT